MQTRICTAHCIIHIKHSKYIKIIMPSIVQHAPEPRRPRHPRPPSILSWHVPTQSKWWPWQCRCWWWWIEMRRSSTVSLLAHKRHTQTLMLTHTHKHTQIRILNPFVSATRITYLPIYIHFGDTYSWARHNNEATQASNSSSSSSNVFSTFHRRTGLSAKSRCVCPWRAWCRIRVYVSCTKDSHISHSH